MPTVPVWLPGLVTVTVLPVPPPALKAGDAVRGAEAGRAVVAGAPRCTGRPGVQEPLLPVVTSKRLPVWV